MSARSSESTDDGQRIAALSAQQSLQLNRFRDDRRFENIRQIGTITAMDFKAADPGYLAQIGPRLRASSRAAGVLLRPLGNTIYVLPPYCVSQEDLSLVYAAIQTAANDLS